MRDARWAVAVGPWHRQISLHGIPVSGHLYRGAPCPGMWKEESGKSKPPRQANWKTGKRGSRTRIEELRPRICPDKTSSTALSADRPSSSSSSFCSSSSRAGLSCPSGRCYTSHHALFSPSHDLFINALYLHPQHTPTTPGQGAGCIYSFIIYLGFSSS